MGDPSGRWSSPLDLAIRQPANTGVLDWAGKLLALFERDLPYTLTPALRTEGRSTLDVFRDGDVVLAHYRIGDVRGERRLVTLAPAIAGRHADCKFVEIDERGRKVRSPAGAHARAQQRLAADLPALECEPSVPCAQLCTSRTVRARWQVSRRPAFTLAP